MSETNERNCNECAHYKPYKEDMFACESWSCEFKPRATIKLYGVGSTDKEEDKNE